MPETATTTAPMSPSQIAKQLAQLQQENAELRAAKDAAEAKAAAKRQFTLKVGVKGGVSVYGIGRFPVTLYAGQWEFLLQNADKIKAFLVEHKAELATKED